jgi:hypothetical protein
LEPVEFTVGTRVRVESAGHWADGHLATVIDQDGWPRDCSAKRGRVRCFFVEFDDAPFDADGDGPYRAAEIYGKDLVPVDE